VFDRSKQLAQLLLADKTADDQARVASLYRRILNRQPRPDEIAGAVQFLTGSKKVANGNVEDKAWQSLVRVLMCSNEFVYVD
jgi:hypothetical protein